MNGKKAKMLRRMAEQMTIGKPTKEYTEMQGTVILVPGTTRSVYKKLKKKFLYGGVGK